MAADMTKGQMTAQAIITACQGSPDANLSDIMAAGQTTPNTGGVTDNTMSTDNSTAGSMSTDNSSTMSTDNSTSGAMSTDNSTAGSTDNSTTSQ